jgi:hypothetical protein
LNEWKLTGEGKEDKKRNKLAGREREGERETDRQRKRRKVGKY